MPPVVRDQRVICGIPLWLLQAYMQDLGGEEIVPGSIKGPGWRVDLERVEDYQIGSIRVGQVQMTLEADPDVYERLKPKLEKKLLRAGG